MPDPYCFLYFATSGESHGIGTGPAGFGGAGCPAAAPGLAGAAAPGTAAAGFAGAAAPAPGLAAASSDLGDGTGTLGGFAGAVVVSDCTDPEGVAFTPPGIAGCSAVGFGSFSGGGVAGLVSSGMSRRHKPPAESGPARTITFISLKVWCQRRNVSEFPAPPGSRHSSLDALPSHARRKLCREKAGCL